MRPNAEAHESDGAGSRNHDRVAEDRLAGKDRDDFGGEREGGDDQDIDFRVSEDPKEVHPEDRRTAGLSVEEMRTGEAVEQEHYLSGRQRGDRDKDHRAHDEVEPR